MSNLLAAATLTHLMSPCLQFAVRLSSVLNTRNVFSACIRIIAKHQALSHDILWGQQKYIQASGLFTDEGDTEVYRTCLISTIEGMGSVICPLGPCIAKVPHITTKSRALHV